MNSGPLHPDRELIIGVTPGARPDGRLVVALCRAGALGVLDAGRDPSRARAEMALVAARHDGPFGVRLGGRSGLGADDLPARSTRSSSPTPTSTSSVRTSPRGAGSSPRSRRSTRPGPPSTPGADGLVAKGAEAGGRVGDGDGLRPAPAASSPPSTSPSGCGAASASTRRPPPSPAGAPAWSSTPSSRSPASRRCRRDVRPAIAGHGRQRDRRGRRAPGLHPARPGRRRAADDRARRAWPRRLGADDLRAQLLPVGQDGVVRRPLADRYKTAGGVVAGHPRRRSPTTSRPPAELRPLAPGGRRRRHPRHRLPDRPGADDPRQRPRRVRRRGRRRRRRCRSSPWRSCAATRSAPLLAETADAARRPAVGRRRPRLRPARAARRAARGGPRGRARRSRSSPAAARRRPRRSRPTGIATYLHVPSPGLLDRFLEGRRPPVRVRGPRVRRPRRPARRASPCGSAQIDRLLAAAATPTELDVLFAGGIHDARSAAMVAALAAPAGRPGRRASAC